MNLFAKRRISVALLILSVFSGFSQTNLLKNPSFEESFVVASVNFDEWSINFNTIREKVTDATDGAAAVKIQTNRSGSNGFFAQLSAAKPSNDLALEKDKTYSVSFDYKVVTGNITELRGTVLEDDFYLRHDESLSDLSPSGWQTMSFTVTATTTTAHNFDINIIGASESAEIMIDNAQVFEKTVSPDREALIAIYDATNGASWTNSWDLEADISEWQGITVDANNRVTEVRLSGNNLVGTIPPAIGDLSELTFLTFSNNELTGNIPNEVGELSLLKQLYLGDNALTGSIPPVIGNLTQLESLGLPSNQLQGNIPSELGSLPKLTYLSIERNGLSGEIPSEIWDLTELTTLWIDNNELTGTISSQIGGLQKLTTVNLSGNRFTGELPIAIYQLPDLRFLELAGNDFSGTIPAEIGGLTALVRYNISGNSITGTIPEEIGQLSALVTIFLSGNELTGQIPSQIGQLENLDYINLSDNRLTGNLPAELGQLSKLEALVIQDNELTGSIPPELGQLPELARVFLSNNRLSGAIPDAITNLSALKIFEVQGNELSGPVPVLNFADFGAFNVSNNTYVFEDLENVVSSDLALEYSPQADIGQFETLSFDQTGPISMMVTGTDSATNSYQWSKNGEEIQGATTAIFVIDQPDLSDVGEYTCAITNTAVPNLELTFRAVRILGADPSQISVKVTGVSCPDAANGAITFSADNEYRYTLNLSGENRELEFENIDLSDGMTQSGLNPGNYSVCARISALPSFEQCFTVNLERPENFESGKTVVTNGKGILVVSGSKNYELSVNNKKHIYSFNDTGNHELSFDLEDGVNTIIAKTDKECQGMYKETVLSNSVRTFPNPSDDMVRIMGLKNSDAATITISGTGGTVIRSLQTDISDTSVNLQIENLPSGIYLVAISSKEQNVQTKIVKK